MNEDGAAPTRHARARVMIDLDDEIIELIVPPQAVAAVIGRALEGTVVAAIGGIFTPSKGRINASGRQQCRRVRMAIRAPPQADEAKAAARRRAITLEFVGANAAAAEHDLQCARSGEQDASGPAPRTGPHADQGKGPPMHGMASAAHVRDGGNSNPTCSFTPECSIPPNATCRDAAAPRADE